VSQASSGAGRQASVTAGRKGFKAELDGLQDRMRSLGFGSAYVGSNPTPATTCGNGPLAAETPPGGPFSSCHAVYQGVSPWVDA
jgi:hypothetical protein